ncbi:hypothetical protein FACS189499_06550 [Clostridia bacterium]|nr:hypothetical protein FACS189499_06550 [Clostridia bacterium]
MEADAEAVIIPVAASGICPANMVKAIAADMIIETTRDFFTVFIIFIVFIIKVLTFV